MVLLSVRDLHTTFLTDAGEVPAVDGVSFDVARGEVVAVVGESGSGKSVTAASILRLLPPDRVRIRADAILWKGEDLLTASDERLRQVRGGEIAMIFQDPLSALNPVHPVGAQVAEMLRVHEGANRRRAAARAVELLALVGIPEPQRRAVMYPHELSGGMRQRVMIAMAIACRPDLLIADEPTTALDVTVQAQILELLLDLKAELDSAILLITHDLGIVAGTADRVVVLYAGRPVELATVDALFDDPRHPYTAGLLDAVPRLDDDGREPLVPIPGAPPSVRNRPTGCAFHPRCAFARLPGDCDHVEPPLHLVGGADHRSACHYAEAFRDSRREPS
jgi:oligopeptide/dipeptide ABC transporter ATP-binding protein